MEKKIKKTRGLFEEGKVTVGLDYLSMLSFKFVDSMSCMLKYTNRNRTEKALKWSSERRLPVCVRAF